MNSEVIFVSGTGTDIGKTFIAGLLLNADPQRQYWKPVQTGGCDLDRQAIESAGGRIAALPTLTYELAASPDQAAQSAGLPPPNVAGLRRTLAAFLEREPNAPLLIEGAGGLMVPLNEENETWLDFLQSQTLPVVLVAASGLGTLNHTLLSVEALQSRGIPILAIILNGDAHPGNNASLRRMHPELTFLNVPTIANEQQRAHAVEHLKPIFKNKTSSSATWLRMDKDFVWHPYTQHQTAPEPIAVVGGRGSYLHTDRGEKLLDASASWWTCSIGHGHPKIGAAIRRQQAQLDHCGFGNATHEAGSTLASKLVALHHGQLQRVFYSDNGSCAVEVALKMAAQAWINRGELKRSSFLFFQGAYHGDTFGAMGVGESNGFHKAFAPFIISGVEGTVVTAHRSRLCPSGPMALDQGIEALDRLFAEHASKLSGVIIEPLVQGASGMNIQDITWLRHLGKLCKQYGVYLILDEVFTGMGRVGSGFAYQRAGLDPDIICFAKGLTGGNLPLAVTMCRESVFEAFLAEDRSKALLHGHTFTGNPIGCAAALATLDVYREEKIWGQAERIEASFQEWLLKQSPRLPLSAGRALGAILAWEVGQADYFSTLAYSVPAIARRHGLLLRTLGNTVYFVPPLCISKKELGEALDGLKRTMEELTLSPQISSSSSSS